MGLHLERHDYYAVTGFLVISVVSGFLIDLFQNSAVISLHDITFYVPAVALFAGLGFIYFAREKYGGEIARSLEITGTGVGLLGIFWLLYAGMFASGFPAWGISPAFWAAFLGTGVVTTFMLTAYGFYTFWKLGEEAMSGGDDS